MTRPSSNLTICIALVLAGLALHVFYLYALGLPGSLEKLLWAHSDSDTYVVPARAFLATGCFAVHGEPDYFRTIGYPFFLAIAMKLGAASGLDWRLVTYYLQAAVFALAYPAIYYLGVEVAGLSTGWALGAVLFTVLSGAFVSYVPVVLSDAMFATALLVGTVAGFHALKTGRVIWALMHVVLIGFAANVRPMLALFPLSAFLAYLSYAKERFAICDGARRLLLTGMLVFTLIGVQTPSARNWVNHGVFTPSESGSMVLFDYLAGDVLRKQGRSQQYQEVIGRLTALNSRTNIAERIAIRKSEAIKAYLQAPLETASYLTFYGVLNLVEMHWNNTLFYMFRQTWYKDYADGTVKSSALPFVLAMPFIAVYFCLYAGALLAVVLGRLRPQVVLSLLLFIAPFAFCLTNYQGARFRLWFEPIIVLAAACFFRMVYRRVRQEPVCPPALPSDHQV